MPHMYWIGGYDEATGLADEIRGFLRALDARGHAPSIREFFKPRHRIQHSPNDRRILEAARRREPGAPCVVVHHYITNNRQGNVPRAVNVARAMFETDTLPAPWLPLLLERDEIWVPCEHNAETFRRGGIPASKIRVLGETIDFDLFSPDADPYPIDVDEGQFVFLSNFDFGERKAWRQLIAGWAKAFGPDDGVTLLLKTGSYTHGEDYARDRIRDYVRDTFGAGALERLAPITVMSERLPTEDIPRLYAAADAYVLASRGEGWGRPYQEAMAMGLPTIASRWSGNLDFMSDDNSWLVDGTLVPVREDAEFFPGRMAKGHNWFEPDVDSVAEAMRAIARDPDGARAKAAGGREELIAGWGTDAIVDRIEELASDILDRRRRPFALALRGPYGSNSSLSVVNDSLIDALDARDRPAFLRPEGISEPVLDQIPGVSHSWPPCFDALSVGPTVLILPWEFGAAPQEWVDEVNRRVDRVWVPSAYVRDGYIASGMPPGVVEVVPNGVDLVRFTPEGPSHELPRQAGCTFLFVGGSTWRKGMDLLVKAWVEAFGPDDDAQLVVKDFGTATHYRGQTAGESLRELEGRSDVAPVTYIDEDMTPDEIAALYRACDVFVTPYRGEGFCMPALEAMACGLPVIHTGIGPTNEFVPEDGGWSVPAERAPLRNANGLPELAMPGFVHEVDHDALVATLREVAAHPEERRTRGAAALVRAQDYDWDRVAAIVEESVGRMAAEELPLAREIGPAQFEHKDELVILAPDWENEESWGPTLERWTAAFGPEDPVTLALYLPAGDPAVLAGLVMSRLQAAGIPEDELPDLALPEPESVSLASMVAAADAVLVDPASIGRPEVSRRARRLLVTPEDLLDYVAEVRATDSEPVAR
jgi:glycosyltransferase involved in cell wall biosynthesis